MKRPSSLENPPVSSPNSKTITFKQYNSKAYVREEAAEVIFYYLRIFEQKRGEKHMKLKPETWREAADSLFLVGDELTGMHDDDLTVSDVISMIDHYFEKEYQAGCNYCITHFNNPGVKKVNYYEAVYGRAYEDRCGECGGYLDPDMGNCCSH